MCQDMDYEGIEEENDIPGKSLCPEFFLDFNTNGKSY